MVVPVPLLNRNGVIRRGLIAEYRFNEYYRGGGQKLYDYSGRGNNGQLGSTSGTDTNDPTWTAQGLSFTTDDYVITPEITVKTISIVFFNPVAIDKDTTNQNLMGHTISTNTRISFGNNTSLLDNEIITVRSQEANVACGWCDASASIAAGWHILHIIRNGTYFRIVLDGTEKPISNYGDGTLDLIFTTIGKYLGGAYFEGSIASILGYSRVLSAAELTHNYNYLKGYLKGRGIMTL